MNQKQETAKSKLVTDSTRCLLVHAVGLVLGGKESISF